MTLPDATTAAEHDLVLARDYALVGMNFERADLRGRNLRDVNLTNANLRGADLSKADLRGAKLVKADLSRACLYGADCEGADFTGADMTMLYARAVNFSRARLWNVSLRRSYCKNAAFFGADLSGANIAFTEFLGARFNDAILTGVRNADTATFYWWVPKGGGPVSYEPKPGHEKWDSSVTGGYTFQENAGPGRGHDLR